MTRVLVTGGSGFLGRAIIQKLLKQGYQVRSFSRSHPKLAHPRLEVFSGSLQNGNQVSSALKNIDAVIHTAAKAGVWGHASDYFAVNTQGTARLLKHMVQQGVAHLVHTSSPSVVFQGADLCGVDATTPYAKQFLCPYPESKMLAEQQVIDFVQQGLVAAIILRPHLIWGQGDPHFLPRLLHKYQAGRLWQVGNGQNLVDVIHVDNAAYAHVLALSEVLAGRHLGQVYFLGQEKPVALWQFIAKLLESQGMASKQLRCLSTQMALRLATVAEGIYKFLPKTMEPPLTRFMVQQLSCSHYFSHQAAQQDLGYQPLVSIDEGLAELATT